MRARRLAASVLLVAVAAGLSGCFLSDPYENHPKDGGATAAEVGAALEAVPGIESADAYSVPWDQPGEGGLFSSAGLDLMVWVTIDPEMHIADSAEFLRGVAQAAWTINDGYSPDGNVNLVIRRGLDRDHDWGADALEVFGGTVVLRRDPDVAFLYYGDAPVLTDEDVLLSIPDGVYRKAFGDWPAAPSALDPSVLAAGAPEVIDPPAVSDVYTSGMTTGGEQCVLVSFHRAVDDAGEAYRGDVTVTMSVGGREYGTLVARGSAADDTGGESGVRFCGDDAPVNRLASVSSHIVAPAEPGFRAVDREGVTTDR